LSREGAFRYLVWLPAWLPLGNAMLVEVDPAVRGVTSGLPGGVSGVELAREAAARHPLVAIVLGTGYAGDRLQGAAAADLPWTVLRKPFRGDQLARALVSALKRETAASEDT
jgi:CheY-like chemotaxis protein